MFKKKLIDGCQYQCTKEFLKRFVGIAQDREEEARKLTKTREELSS
ncbi:MAG: hypothetical protein ACXQTS_00300 [Candidatus Methanospirareceae archaeon]